MRAADLRNWGNIREAKRVLVAWRMWRVVSVSSSADQHCERRRQTLLLPPLHLRRWHREYPAGVQRLPGHHPENAPAAVRTLVMGDRLRQPSVFCFVFFFSTILQPWRTFPPAPPWLFTPHPQKKPTPTAPPVEDYEVLLKCVKSSSSF